MNFELTQKIMFNLLNALEIDCDEEGKKTTALRLTRLWEDLLSGHGIDAAETLDGGFSVGHHEMVALLAIPFYSMCEHHFLPFYGSVDLAYLPGSTGYVAGASKLGEVVEVVSKRLQVQERLTTDISDAIDRGLQSKGSYVVVQAEHLCMTMKDRKNISSRLVTVSRTGVFRESHEMANQALALLNRRDSSLLGTTDRRCGDVF